MNLKNLKKIAEAVGEEMQKEVARIVTMFSKDKEREGRTDLESLEMRIRNSMHGVGALMLGKLLNSDGGDYGILQMNSFMVQLRL